MSALAVEPRFTFDEWSRIVGDPTKNNAYLSSQLGKVVAEYLSWKRNEDGAADTTIATYERVLAQLVLIAVAGDTDSLDGLTLELYRNVRDLRPEKSRRLVTAVYKDFSRWLYEEGRTPLNTAGRLRYPKRIEPPITDLFTEEEKAAIVTAQTDIMDRVGVLLLFRAGLRKTELRNLTVQDVNLVEKYVLVRRGKGGKSRRVPVRGAVVRALDQLLLTDVAGTSRSLELTDHLLSPWSSRHRARRCPDRSMSQRGAHQWWYECLHRAGIVDVGEWSGRRMHASRHTYATDLGRANGWNMLAVQKNLGHAKLATTADTYTQFAYEDQEAAVDLLPEIDEVGA